MIYPSVVSFALGIAFEEIFGLGWSAGVLVFVVSLVLFVFSFRSQGQPLRIVSEGLPLNISRLFLIIGLAFCLGTLRMAVVDISPDSNLLEHVGQKISFEAVVSEEADIRDASTRYIVSVNLNSLSGDSLECLASLTEASTRKNSAEFYPCITEDLPNKNSNSLILLVADRFPELEYGDKISVSGKLELPKNFLSESGTEFDYISYLSKDKIHFIIYRPELYPTSSSSTELRGARKIVATLYLLKKIFIEKISAVVPEPNSSLLGGLIFGVKQSLGAELLDDFRKVGLIHIVVLSGYNITIIAIGIFYLTSFLGKRNLSFILSAIFIILFSIMVGLGATVIRASIMALIAILARFLGRPSDALRFLFIAGFLMLLWNPLLLFYDPSFQLSFMATFGLILFSPFVFSKLNFVPEKFGLREIVSATIAVQFFVLPLLIRMSGFVSIVSFIANPLVLPLVPWAMAFGALTGALGILPFVGQIVSWPVGVLSYFISQIIIGVTEFGANLPFAILQTGSISFWFILVWYLGYGVLYRKLKERKFS